MDGWGSGYLCRPCLVNRLGRDLVDDDYLSQPVAATGAGIEALVKPAYAERQIRGEESDTDGL